MEPTADCKERVLKTRLKHLISDPECTQRIQGAVQRSNAIITNAYIFAKLWLLDRFDAAYATADYKSTKDQPSHHSSMDAFSSGLSLDVQFFRDVIVTVSSPLGPRRGRPHRVDRQPLLKAMGAAYAEYVEWESLPQEKPDPENLSITFYYSAREMATAYKNNICAHFDKYIRRVVRTHLRTVAVAANNVPNFASLPVAIRQHVNREVNFMVDDILQYRYNSNRK